MVLLIWVEWVTKRGCKLYVISFKSRFERGGIFFVKGNPFIGQILNPKREAEII